MFNATIPTYEEDKGDGKKDVPSRISFFDLGKQISGME